MAASSCPDLHYCLAREISELSLSIRPVPQAVPVERAWSPTACPTRCLHTERVQGALIQNKDALSWDCRNSH